MRSGSEIHSGADSGLRPVRSGSEIHSGADSGLRPVRSGSEIHPLHDLVPEYWGFSARPFHSLYVSDALCF